MALISQSFLLLFLPVLLALYYYLCRTPRQKLWLLLSGSYLFYALGGLEFVPLLMGLSFATFWLARRGRAGCA